MLKQKNEGLIPETVKYPKRRNQAKRPGRGYSRLPGRGRFEPEPVTHNAPGWRWEPRPGGVEGVVNGESLFHISRCHNDVGYPYYELSSTVLEVAGTRYESLEDAKQAAWVLYAQRDADCEREAGRQANAERHADKAVPQARPLVSGKIRWVEEEDVWMGFVGKDHFFTYTQTGSGKYRYVSYLPECPEPEAEVSNENTCRVVALRQLSLFLSSVAPGRTAP